MKSLKYALLIIVYFLCVLFYIMSNELIRMLRYERIIIIAGLVFLSIFVVKGMVEIVKMLKARTKLSNNPTVDVNFAKEFGLGSYASYFEAHKGHSYDEMLPKCPPRYKAFLIFTVVLSIILVVVGIILVGPDLIIILVVIKRGLVMSSTDLFEAAIFHVLGHTAIFFGVKDVVESLISLRKINCSSM